MKPAGVPAILFSTGTASHLRPMAALGYDVLSVDWRIPIDEARAAVPEVAIQGNLDPTFLLGPKELLLGRARAILRAAGPRPGYIFNLGHGIEPGTPPENVKALVEAVHAFRWQ
jgi:uroporphyrinogen decarboxylase